MASLDGARQVERLIHTYGCLPATGDGQVLPEFTPQTLAEAIEREIQHANEYGWSKLTLHFDIPDAALLAQHLRK